MKILSYPRFKAFKDDNSPAAGWKAQFYLAGTTTPATTYVDEAGSASNPNPVILDGSGEADIWLDIDIEYKLVLKDENDAVQRTVDDIEVGDGGWASPGAIGTGTPNTGRFESLDVIEDATIRGRSIQAAANGAAQIMGQIEEDITLSTSTAHTDSAANLLPAGSLIDGVVFLVLESVTTATAFSLGDSAQPTRFSVAQTGTQLLQGASGVALNQYDPTGATSDVGPIQFAASPLRITTTGTPGAGKIRVTVFYRQYVALTS